MVTCPACGQENPEGFRLCGMCGAALVPATGRPREERKVVTILFTDLVGSTARAEGLDPADVRATLSPYYAQLRAELGRHGAARSTTTASRGHPRDPGPRRGPSSRRGR